MTLWLENYNACISMCLLLEITVLQLLYAASRLHFVRVCVSKTKERSTPKHTCGA